MNPKFLTKLALLAALLISPQVFAAKSIYVSPIGRDSGAGTLASPYGTITKAYSVASAGDTIYLRGGTYREQVSLTSKSGSGINPITLTAYGQETPVISGLDIFKATWTQTTNTSSTNNAVVYVATLPSNSPYVTTSDFTNPVTPTVLQLFYKGQPMLQARWPRCPTNADGSWNFFATNTWAYSGASATYGTMWDSNLTNLPANSINGAMAVLNVGHQYYTWTRVATNATTNSFQYDTNGIQNAQYFTNNCYYLFGKKEFLDSPGEWYYDGTNKLYFMTPDGASPANGLVEIKTRQVGYMADSTCTNLTVQGITFFGTAFKFGTSYYNNSRSSKITFSSNTVTQSSWTEYFNINTTSNGGSQDTYYPTIYADDSRVFNNSFSCGSLFGLQIHGFRNVVENNSFSNFDYCSSLQYPPLQVNQPWPGLTNTAGNCVVRYNSLSQSGGIQLQVAQGTNDVYLNNLSGSFLACYGGNKDTAALYFQNYFIAGTRVHHNWVQGGYSGTPPFQWGGGIGIRGDDQTCGVTVDHNVTWNVGSAGIQLKNSNNVTVAQGNQCVNNSVLNDSSYNTGTNSIIMPYGNGTNPASGLNTNSVVANNLAVTILTQFSGSGGTTVTQGTSGTNVRFMASNVMPSTETALAGLLAFASTNTNSAWVDFRPASNASSLIGQGSTNSSQIATNLPGISTCTNWPILATNGSGVPDVGAYQRTNTVYWIPGQRLAKASYPIVSNGATNVPGNRDVLMWKPAYGATSSTVYYSPNSNSVATGSRGANCGSFTGENNVFTIPAISGGSTYYWRVDSVMPNGAVIKGDVWSFKTQP